MLPFQAVMSRPLPSLVLPLPGGDRDWGLSHGKVGLDEKLWNEAKLWGLANWFSVLKLVFRVGQAFMVAIYL